jgi:hypothetical protein
MSLIFSDPPNVYKESIMPVIYESLIRAGEVSDISLLLPKA